jgi:nicotinamide riboside kinase
MQARRRFFDLSQAILEERRVTWALISGQGEARYHNMLAAIERLTRD